MKKLLMSIVLMFILVSCGSIKSMEQVKTTDSEFTLQDIYETLQGDNSYTFTGLLKTNFGIVYPRKVFIDGYSCTVNAYLSKSPTEENVYAIEVLEGWQTDNNSLDNDPDMICSELKGVYIFTLFSDDQATFVKIN